MHPLLRLIAHAPSLTEVPSPISEASWDTQKQNLESLRALLQVNPGKVFSLYNPQTAFPVVPVSLIASVLTLIPKNKVGNIYEEQYRMLPMNTRVR